MDTTPAEPQKQGTALPGRDVRRLAGRISAILNKNIGDSFLDRDVADVARGIAGFLNRDVIGRKIILLEDEDLARTAGSVALFLKRERHLYRTEAQKKIIARIKSLYRYFNHPFLQRSEMVRKTREYLKKNLRKMTPAVVEGLDESRRKLETYFDSRQVWNNRLFENNFRLRQIAMELRYQQYGLCRMRHEPLALNRDGEVFCSFTACKTRNCPFGAIAARGEEVEFLRDLKEILKDLVF